jgi:hypothetical protein
MPANDSASAEWPFPQFTGGRSLCRRCRDPLLDGELFLCVHEPKSNGLYGVHLRCAGPEVAQVASAGLVQVSSGGDSVKWAPDDIRQTWGTRAMTQEEHDEYNKMWEAEQARRREEAHYGSNLGPGYLIFMGLVLVGGLLLTGLVLGIVWALGEVF